MGEPRRPLGPLGRRLLAAFLLVALSSVAVLTLAALVGTARGLQQASQSEREAAAAASAAEAASAYSAAGGWVGADLSAADAVAAEAGARLVVRDAEGSVVRSPGSGAQGAGAGSGSGSVSAPVVVAGEAVGTVRLAFGSGGAGAVQQIAWTWILVAAGAAVVVAAVSAWFVTRRITGPLVRLAGTARSFAAGDRTARAAAADVDAPGELGDLARAFDATAAQVDRAERVRQRMSADLAHELRTPLTALQAGLEELRDGLVAPDHGRIVALHEQSLRMGRVVQDLAELSAAESAAVSLHLTDVDLSTLVSGAVSAARSSLAAAGLEAHVDLAEGVTVRADPDRLHQVVANLLANVARHCRAGDSVTVAVGRAGTWAALTVADTGPGIDPHQLSQVFDRLWRGDADTEGSGIGLAVVRELVVAHGGSVTASSDGSSGTTMTVLLPLAPELAAW